MPKEPKITIAVLAEFDSKARRRLGREDLRAEDYVGLAQEAEEGGRYRPAAVYYHLASLAAPPGRRAELFRVLSEEMLDRVSLGGAGEW